MRSYAAETCHGQEYIDRWHRVLATLGAESFDNLEPMTATEAQTMLTVDGTVGFQW